MPFSSVIDLLLNKLILQQSLSILEMTTAQETVDDNVMCRHKCTCGPYPTVDISLEIGNSTRFSVGSDGKTDDGDAHFHDHSRQHPNTRNDGCEGGDPIFSDQSFGTIGREVQNACESHGCFHLQVRVADNPNGKDTDKERKGNGKENTIDDTESSASPDFFPLWNPPCDVAQDLEFLFSAKAVLDPRNRPARSMYRGRCAESGSNLASQSEPKQSWELKRCRRASIKHTATNLDYVESSCRNSDNMVDRTLQSCINVLHEVAKLLQFYMDLPYSSAGQQLIVSDLCSCCGSSKEIDEGSKAKKSNSLCNHDLLRLFRYDAVSRNDSDGALSDDKCLSLGSSPHTDWGTLTIVWQDEVGGLEVYCHAHQKWNAVCASVQSSSTPVVGYDEVDGSSFLNLFVHVGDFLSLAKGVVTKKAMDESSTSNASAMPPSSYITQLRWPSPLHRVISPENRTRYSLVYFLYPHCSLTLSQAEGLFQQQNSTSNPGQSTICQPCRQEELLRTFYVLQDQSSSNSLAQKKSSLQDLETLLHRPFASEIIASKWNQVQR